MLPSLILRSLFSFKLEEPLNVAITAQCTSALGNQFRGSGIQNMRGSHWGVDDDVDFLGSNTI
jgi:hypothetical protein